MLVLDLGNFRLVAALSGRDIRSVGALFGGDLLSEVLLYGSAIGIDRVDLLTMGELSGSDFFVRRRNSSLRSDLILSISFWWASSLASLLCLFAVICDRSLSLS